MADTIAEGASEVFADHRELLFSMVYNMLGSVDDTEDVLQDTWLAWSGRNTSGGSEIEHPRAYLVRIAINQAIARRIAIRKRRETYVGPWLPEPLVDNRAHTADAADAAEATLRAESVSMALLVVLETLTPLERAVFVLHEVFGYPHSDVAAMLDRTPAAIRQLSHRAREHVDARRTRQRADARMQRKVTEKFLVASTHGGNIEGLLAMLAPDVTMWSDGGGKRHAALRPIHGSDRVSRLLAGPTALSGVPELRIEYRLVNGDPSAVVYSGAAPYAVVVLDIDPVTEKIHEIYTINNPDKLAGIVEIDIKSHE
ncbi:RNA polymerase sigma factor SigJ [Antrihabitans cavernicola]|uniref:Sigma-70 family RNA polymerase sigma factor n=1 Tax=Antrihabitans cavernicola TaxID=2495913 RepID=A0A5A7S429_9NOCA|nr:RNA polymerase sigma factor SigJ [Spelaeibacter cavernicola]KAA0020149.1 sigma-70 family RNA polymerase sigma factor [Spelaeibacter cavernicola]